MPDGHAGTRPTSLNRHRPDERSEIQEDVRDASPARRAFRCGHAGCERPRNKGQNDNDHEQARRAYIRRRLLIVVAHRAPGHARRVGDDGTVSGSTSSLGSR